MRRRLPLRRRMWLARLRRLWLRRLWLLRVMGTLPHLLKGKLRPASCHWPELNRASGAHRKGAS